MSSARYLLAIESTCDETAAAIIRDDLQVMGSALATQTEVHRRFQGIVPELASRAHVERIIPVIDEALRQALLTPRELAAIAVATKPGLAGSLLVGVSAAKAMAMALAIPLVAIDHLEAHLYACRMAAGPVAFPSIGFVVSGGHTSLYDCESALSMRLVGGTTDDAAGEAFDKVANLLELGQPGGPAIEALAQEGDPTAHSFPRSFFHDDTLRFSFSGLKTAVRYQICPPGTAWRGASHLSQRQKANLAASFQAAVIEALLSKVEKALDRFGRPTLCVGGGVAANRALRAALETLAARKRTRLVIAPREWCTDNAVMGALGWERLNAGLIDDLAIEIEAGLVRPPF